MTTIDTVLRGTTKIRGVTHFVYQRGFEWQVCMHDVEEYGWSFSRNTAAQYARQDFDARIRLLEQRGFKGEPVTQQGGEILIKKGMQPYSGWTEDEHCDWIADLTGLDRVALKDLVGLGCVVTTDELADPVVLHAFDHFQSPAWVIYKGE